MDNRYRSVFALDTGRLYVGRGVVSADTLESDTYFAGDTCGSRLVYSAAKCEIRDEEGEVAATVMYDPRLKITGSLKYMNLDAIASLTANTITHDSALSDTLSFAGGAVTDKVSVLLVCPLPDGTDFSVYIRGSAASGFDFDMKDGRQSAVSFELESDPVSGAGHLSIKRSGV